MPDKTATPSPDTAVLPAIMTVDEVRKYLRVSRQVAYGLVAEPGFPVLRVGRLIRIPTAAFLRWLHERSS
ncbi:MAG TPA: helix-turn-helix domain-containing protein [Alphaproteobacteria bacterium]|nr:helix-turn-helix domain-containing protein [Alphaproteobacteria bacterium]